MKTRSILSAVFALALASTAGTALAATADAPAATQGERTEQAMYAFADQNHDGRLTRDEARFRLPMTYASFDRIDTAGRGWISYEQFAEFTNRRTDRQADAALKVGSWH